MFLLSIGYFGQPNPSKIFSEMKVRMWRTGDRRLCLGVFFLGGLASSKCKMAIPSSMDFSGNFQNCYNLSTCVSTSMDGDHLRTHTSPSSQVIDASLCWEISTFQKKTTTSNRSRWVEFPPGFGAVWPAKMLVLPWRRCRSICYLWLPIPAPESESTNESIDQVISENCYVSGGRITLR